MLAPLLRRRMSTAAPGTGIVVAWITAPPSEAPGLARKIVESRHAACVNIIPAVQSVFEWEGKVQDDTESLLMVKTTRDRAEALTEFVKKEHSYTVPEVIFADIAAGNGDYLSWVRQQVARRGDAEEQAARAAAAAEGGRV